MPPKRPQDKKGDLRNKNRQEDITHENYKLNDKINNLKHRHLPDPIYLSHTDNLKAPIRYEDDIKIDSMEMEDGEEPVKCIIPAQKYRGHPAYLRPQLKSYYSQKQSNSTRKQRPMSFHRTDKTQRTRSQHVARED